MGTPQFAVPALKSIIDSKKHEVVAVFTQRPKAKNRGMKEENSPVHDLALKHNIPVYTPNTLKNSDALDLINSMTADIIVVVAYGFIIPQAILEAKKHGCLNIHPSKLPRYRGAAPLQRTVINGEKETAVCIMQMDAGVDTGDIILEKHLNLSAKITLQELHDICAQIGSELLIEVLDNIDTLPRIKQSETGASYAPKLTKEEGRVNWQESAYRIECKVRGMNPWPGVYFEYEDRLIKILAANYVNLEHTLTPGTVMNKELHIACGEGVLVIEKLQQAGKKPLAVEEFIRGVPIQPGTKL